MSTSFLAATTQRAVDSSSVNAVPWDELSGPALLSVAAHLLDEWPNSLFCLCSGNSACHGWHEALTCDSFWAMLCNASGLKHEAQGASFGSSKEFYIANRGVSLSTPECSRGYLDTDILPRQITYEFDLPFLSPRTPTPQQHCTPQQDCRHLASSTCFEYHTMCTQACRKLSSHPDTSWAFSERGFSRHTDSVIWLSFGIERASDEIRVGFTDDREALLSRQGAPHMPTSICQIHEPRLALPRRFPVWPCRVGLAAWLCLLMPRVPCCHQRA